MAEQANPFFPEGSSSQGDGVHHFDDKAFMDHAERCWEAECENAARIAEQKKLLSAAVLGILGLGLFKVEWLGGGDDVSRLFWPWVTIIMKALLTCAIILFCISLSRLYRASGAGGGLITNRTSSEALSFTSGDSGPVTIMLTATKTYRASLDLKRRNLRNWESLQESRRLFGKGFLLVVVALILYICFSSPPIIRQGANDGSDNRQTERATTGAGYYAPERRFNPSAGEGVRLREPRDYGSDGPAEAIID